MKKNNDLKTIIIKIKNKKKYSNYLKKSNKK